MTDCDCIIKMVKKKPFKNVQKTSGTMFKN